MKQSILSIVITCIVAIFGVSGNIGNNQNNTDQVETSVTISENVSQENGNTENEGENPTDEQIPPVGEEVTSNNMEMETGTSIGGNGCDFEGETSSLPENVTTSIIVTKPTTVPETTKEVVSTERETTTRKPIIPVPETTTKSENISNSSYVNQVVELVNQERRKQGLKSLTIDKGVEAAAQIRAKEIEKSFSHTRPSGKNFSSVLTENGINFRGSGENIAWGQRTPQEVMEGWMNSPGHRANILNRNFTKIGVGYYVGANGRKYWTQLFIY